MDLGGGERETKERLAAVWTLPSTHLLSPATLALNQAAALTLLRYVRSLFVTLFPDSRIWFSVAASLWPAGSGMWAPMNLSAAPTSFPCPLPEVSPWFPEPASTSCPATWGPDRVHHSYEHGRRIWACCVVSVHMHCAHSP